MSKETQPKKSVEQTFLDACELKKAKDGRYMYCDLDMKSAVDLSVLLNIFTPFLLKHLEREGHIKLTGTYKP